MVAVPFIFVILGLVLYAIAGMAIGALTGSLTSLMTKCGSKEILTDSLFGVLGSLVGFIGCVFMPWRRNTVVVHLTGGGTVATITSTYQHPERVAIVMAVLLPLLHELYRFNRARTNPAGG